jgi:peptide-methionine (R)-S-oxide reductase
MTNKTSPTDTSSNDKAPSKKELRKKLTEEQFQVTQMKATEAPYSGKYATSKDPGTYVCVCCGEPLFSSKTKFDSGSGWPSFYEPIKSESVKTAADTSHGAQRTEVMCKRCNAHLGHVFKDAPQQPTGVRFCINSAALDLKKNPGKTKDAP